MSNRTRNRTTESDSKMYVSTKNEGKSVVFFKDKADAEALVSGDRSVYRKKLAMAGFTHLAGSGYGGLEALDQKGSFAEQVRPIYMAIVDRLPDVELELSEDEGWEFEADSGTAAAQSTEAPF